MEKIAGPQDLGHREKTERKIGGTRVKTCAELQRFSRANLSAFRKFGLELYDLCRGLDDRRSSRTVPANR